MGKITQEHLHKKAIVYIRQSTMGQVEHNLESQRLQYGLQDQALRLGWRIVEVIDDDLGCSGSGSVHRAGFEQLCQQVCLGEVGAVFCMEASRLARNGREWHTLVEICAIVRTLIIDHDGIYDPGLIDDRLLLGLKGTFSEMELSLFRQRSQAALKEKSRRGELFLRMAVGYKKAGKNGLEKDPDRRVADALGLVFKKFCELGSARQTLLWFCKEKVELPRLEYGPEGGKTVWRLPTYGAILKILTNPIYAGSYTYGRTGHIVSLEGGKKRIKRGCKKEMSDWEVLILGHHEGYISWEEFQFNQQVLAQNVRQRGDMVKGAATKGKALLTGLLRCGHCGRKMRVNYGGSKWNIIRYYCLEANINYGSHKCISFGGWQADRAVSQAILEVLTPLGCEAAIKAAQTYKDQHAELIRQKELSLQQADYEADRTQRQYQAVEPENRLVAAELERRWNSALTKAEASRAEIVAMKEANPMILSAEEQTRIHELGHDVSALWHHPSGDVSLKKRILRTVLVEIIASVDSSAGTIRLILHWQGGEHTQIIVAKNRTGQHRYRTAVDTIELIRSLARCLPDKLIASLLNRKGIKTVKGHSWTQSGIRTARHYHKIPVYIEGERQSRGEMTLAEVSGFLKISPSSVRRVIVHGIIPAKQVCPGAPWIIKQTDLEKPEVRQWILSFSKERFKSLHSDNFKLSFE